MTLNTKIIELPGRAILREAGILFKVMHRRVCLWELLQQPVVFRYICQKNRT